MATGNQNLPGYISKVEVELMIEQTLKPIHQELTEIKAHNSSWYGNGSGRKGYIERMEESQNQRWSEQVAFKEQVLAELAKLSHTIKSVTASTTAVRNDRHRIITVGLVILGIAVDIYFRIHGK